MKLIDWAKDLLYGRKAKAPVAGAPAKPLREFVYLDEVSLRSLLSSQTGEVTDTKSEQRSDALQARLDSAIGVNAPLLTKGELTSRFQTSNSSTLQTSRKATVQSWFREFHGLPKLRLIEPRHEVLQAAKANELLAIEDRSIVAPAVELVRGALVEFRVRLSADPVFHLGTMVSEFTGMVDDSPDLFAGNSALTSLDEAQRINKILQRLLAGLIPVRAEAVDYAVVEIEGVEYIAHRKCLTGLELERRRFEIVGVTEHLAYWKDIRRVLFSQAEFTMLCRVARSGLQQSWTPVKLADLFRVVAPDMVDQINAASRTPFIGGNMGTSVSTNELLLNEALHDYKRALLATSGKQLTLEQETQLDKVIERLMPQATTVTGQRSAFQRVQELLFDLAKVQVELDHDAVLRERARTKSGLPLFPSMSNNMTTVIGEQTALPNDAAPRLLDVEVVAIYW